MKNIISSTSLTGLLILLSSTAHAAGPVVPEIDVSMGAIAIGLTAGIVALVQEHRRKK
jgi:hypothetical protein